MAGRKKAKARADAKRAAREATGDADTRDRADARPAGGTTDEGPHGSRLPVGATPVPGPNLPYPPTRNELLVGAVALFALHAFACMWARNLGFDHISDDDFTRVTIAQRFAHAAHLDPSGTSWLPFPFWILGLGMKLLGRDLDTARGLSIFFASAAAPLPWVALRVAGVPRWRAFVATLFALGTPWAIWTGAATVPESFTATLSAAAVVGLVHARTARGVVAFALGMLAACWSRYDAWPMAAVLAIGTAVTAWRSGRRDLWIAVAICVAGPLLWMAWNAHAHDGPLHFFRRVSNYKRAIGEGSTSTFDALVLFPKLVLALRPEAAIPALVLSPLAFVDKALRRRWAIPVLAVVAQVAFLSIGNARDGAAAHHSERALLGSFVVLALFVGDVVLTPWVRIANDATKPPPRPRAQQAFTGFVAVAWLVSLFRADGTMPGTQPSEDRSEQVQRGEKLYREGAKHLEVTPCGYEHFALIAAYGAPENVDVNPARYGGECPTVVVKD